ncbi:Antitoxin of toxin-antitoxin stability system [Streptococcus suis GZ1]|uniref:Antitoxin n=1 Tax=Streptococcus suis (strain GZ1) TaxID=423211 RepID=D5AKB1_STRGZ|nr:Antitoxin of toxin-antitoxin stability system [Streptococcus suis GZ1]
MEAIVYSHFRNHLKDYMKKVNDEFEPLVVVNKNPEEDIVVLSKSEWDSLQETLAVARNTYLSQKSYVVWLKSKRDKPKNET